MPTKINTADYNNIVLLTGAGISAASGLSTYRGPGGIWNDKDVARFSHKEGFAENPKRAWEFWGLLRGKALEVQPNAAHLHLAKLEAAHAGKGKFVVVTQNVDGLHQRAGSKSVIELHGSLMRSRCSDPRCKQPSFPDTQSYDGKLPNCPQCGANLRPDITLFGEELPAEAEHNSKRALRDCDLFLAIGTSGTVAPASHFVFAAKYAGAYRALLNLEPIEGSSHSFDQQILGKAEEIVPQCLL